MKLLAAAETKSFEGYHACCVNNVTRDIVELAGPTVEATVIARHALTEAGVVLQRQIGNRTCG